MGVPRKRIRLTLRVLMLGIACLAVFLGWQVHKARQQREAVAAVRRHGGDVGYNHDFVSGVWMDGKNPWGPKWLRRLIGDEYFQSVVYVRFSYSDSDEGAGSESCDDVLKLLSSQDQIRCVFMFTNDFTSDSLANLKGLANLESLYLMGGTELPDLGLESIRGLRNLKYLEIVGSTVTDRSMLALADMTNMEVLALESDNISDLGLAAVRKMENLSELRIRGRRESPSLITDDGVALVSGLKNLKELELSYSKVTNKGLARMASLTKLESLILDGCKVGDEGLRNLMGLKKLRWLTVHESNVGDAGLEYVKELPGLRFLQISRTRVTDAGKLKLKKAMPHVSIN